MEKKVVVGNPAPVTDVLKSFGYSPSAIKVLTNREITGLIQRFYREGRKVVTIR